MTLTNILQQPTEIEYVGKIYQICLKDWDEFETYLNILMLSKKHIPVNTEVDVPLLHRIVLGYQDDHVNETLCKIFNRITRTNTFKLHIYSDSYEFKNEGNQIVNADNYEKVRSTVLHQNVLFEPKVYKDKLMQEWAEKVLEARSKNAANITLEDMVSTVASLSGKHYSDIENYSIYQLRSEFGRWNKIKQFESMSNYYANPYAASEVNLEHFAECLDLFADPYADVFKSKDKFANINKAFSKND